MQKPFGLRPLKSIISNDYNASIVEAIVEASDSTALFVNDLVTSLPKTDGSGIVFCTKSTPSASIRGVVVSFKPDRTYENETYRKENTRRVVKICQDPFLLFRARVDQVMSTDDIDKYIDIDTADGERAIGISLVSLDYSTISSIDGQIKILKIIEIVDTDDEKYSIVECMISKHELLRGVSLGHGYWDRIVNDLVPDNIGDNINLEEAGRGKGFLDPVSDYDVVNLRYLVNYVSSIGLGEPKVDVLTVTSDGQTAFTLSEAPINSDAIIVTVRGQTFFRNNGGTIGFTVSGTNLTWSNPKGLSLKTTDEVVAWYNFISSVPTPPPVFGYWDRSGTDLFPKFSGDSVDLQQLGRGKGFLDPVNDYDVVNKRYLESAVPSITAKKEVVDVTSSVYNHDKVADVAKVFTNFGATAQVEFVLPTVFGADKGIWWEYHTMELQDVQVKALGGDYFIYQDTQITTLETNEPGAILEVIVMSDGKFHIGKIHGNWSYLVP